MFDMGGYGVYVWSSFGISALVLLANVWTARRLFRSNHESARNYAEYRDTNP